MTTRISLPALALALTAAVAAGASAAPVRDGAIITNSGSTNTAAYRIKLWSDGSASVQVQGRAARSYRADADATARFFTDVKAARSNPGTPQHCMKSASFGTVTTVAWHGYTSVDLQCPPFTPSVAKLAADVTAVQASANLGGAIRRIPLPRDVRMIPTATPEVQPT